MVKLLLEEITPLTPPLYNINRPLVTEILNDGKRYPYSVLSYPVPQGKNNTAHPTQKPTALAEWLVKTYSNESDTVLDPFMGSGTTGVACKKLNRNFIGCEIEKSYFEIAEKRMAAVDMSVQANLCSD